MVIITKNLATQYDYKTGKIYIKRAAGNENMMMATPYDLEKYITNIQMFFFFKKVNFIRVIKIPLILETNLASHSSSHRNKKK